MINIKKCSLDLMREPLKSPFGFKGGYLSELWQPVVKLESENFSAVCPSVQSVLWSDARIFTSNPEAAGNAMMFTVTAAALRMIEGVSFDNPAELSGYISRPLLNYAATVCRSPVAPTFALNSLVGIDFALWMLYAAENGINSFEGIIPQKAGAAMSSRHEKLAHIPLVSYAVGEDGIRRLLDDGTALMKVKLGRHISGAEGSEEDMKRMVEWDSERLCAVHALAKEYTTPLTADGRVRYYLDANGRYDTKERLCVLLEAADKCGALPYIELIEEPFPESEVFDVSDLSVTIGADESAHSLDDLQSRLRLGYRAVALKPAAKTLSLTFSMAAEAAKAGAGCLVADLTVNPLLAMWNRHFASHVTALPGMNVGCVEVNGDMNYKNWDEMIRLLPNGMVFTPPVNGAFIADNEFYAASGRLFADNGYCKIFEK